MMANMGNESVGAALQAGDQLLAELAGVPSRPSIAPTMGRLQKVRYTHEAMIDFIIENPCVSQNALAAHFGFTPGWISNILASDSFQAAMASRREEIVDPELKASIEERFRALVIRSHKVLMDKLALPQVSDQVALRALELGARALGVGGNAPPVPPPTDRLIRLAERLVDLQSNVRQGVIYEGQLSREGESAAEGRAGREVSGPESRGDGAAEGSRGLETYTG